jgi:uncharacterized membrane protein
MALAPPPPTSPARPGLHACGPLAAALMLCAVACAALLATRWIAGGVMAYPFLAWNLFLAGLPFAFALLASLVHESAHPGRLRSGAVAASLVLWLLFFPNAPYLVTDLAHLRAGVVGAPRWFDAVLFGAFAATGVASGFASLLLVHGLVARRLGRLAGWSAIGAASLLGGYGIYLGRFSRLNSWDVLARPERLLRTVLDPLLDPTSHARTIAVSLLYAGFILLGYLAVVAMLHAGRHVLPDEPPPAGTLAG